MAKRGKSSFPIPPKETIEELRKNCSMLEAANRLNVSYDTFKKWFYHYFPDVERRPGINNVPMPSKKELETLLQDNPNISIIAEKYQVCKETVRRWMKKLEIEQQRFYTLSDVARMLNVSRMCMSVKWRKGELPGAVKLENNRVVIPESTFLKLKEMYEPYFAGIHYGKKEMRYRFKGEKELLDRRT